jgi:cytochrome c peroxidase
MRNNYLIKLINLIVLQIIFTGLLSMITFGQSLTQKQLLGKQLYFDTNLSSPNGQACSSCHIPSAGYTDPDHSLPVSKGVIPGRYGNRSSPTSAYACYSPQFHFDAAQNRYIGGQFWDGRAADLFAQAKGPFLNPLEMNNSNQSIVVEKVRTSTYASQFINVYGPDAFQNVSQAYDNIARAIADYESSSELNKFTSKYDYYLQGRVNLTSQELRGLALFNGRGKCSTCHPSNAGPYCSKPLFTNYTYENLGIPKNPANPFYTLPPEFNPAGSNWIDKGLGGVLGLTGEKGKMKVPTLRNITLSSPYSHNGYFKTLTEIVQFYNKRDRCGGGGRCGGGMGGGCGMGMWGAPEVAENLNKVIGNLGLCCRDESDIVAFLNTLTDGYSLAKEVAEGPEDQLKVNVNGYVLEQNYPNPFNPSTSIVFVIPYDGQVVLSVYNILGDVVSVMVNEYKSAGIYRETFNASALPSGTYFYSITVKSADGNQNFNSVKKMILMK